MSAQIWTERNDYYAMLEKTQEGDLDITLWLLWFVGCLDRAFDGAATTLATVMRKARFWESVPNQPLNDRLWLCRRAVHRSAATLESLHRRTR